MRLTIKTTAFNNLSIMIHDFPMLRKRIIVAMAMFVFVICALNGQSDSIIYFNYRRGYIDSIYFPASGKKIKVRNYNVYNVMTGLEDTGRTPEGNVIWSRKPGSASSFFSSRLPLLDSCGASSLYSNTHVFTDGRRFTCIAYQLVSKGAEAGIVLYSTVFVFDRHGEVAHQLLHLKGMVTSPCVDENGQYLTFFRFVPDCKENEGRGSNCVYSLSQNKFIYDFPADNWNSICLTDGYIGLMTLPEETFKRYRVFDFREKRFYDMKIPYEQVAKIKKVTRDGFRMKERNGEMKVVPYKDFAAPEKFPG